MTLTLSLSTKNASDVTKISSCRVNTASRQGIKKLGISFGSVFLLFFHQTSLVSKGFIGELKEQQ